MRFNLLIVAGLVVAVCGLCTVGCSRKAKGPAKLDPHSAEGILAAMHDQAKKFDDAIGRQDYTYLHDYGYYFIGVVVAFNAKIDEADKQRLQPQIKELLDLAAQLDRAGGGQHAEAAKAVISRIDVVLGDLDQQYHQGKQPQQAKQ